MLSLELYSDTLPAGKTLIFDLTNKETLDSLKKNTVTIKEGIEYKYAITIASVRGQTASDALIQRPNEVQG